MAEERRRWGRGEGREKEGEREAGAREGRAGRGQAGVAQGRDCSQRQGQWDWGSKPGSLGRGLDVEGACSLLNPSGSSPRP